jgi:hypothetical protein
MVDNHWIPAPNYKAKTSTEFYHKYAEAWRRAPKILIGVHDLRSRKGTLNTPWNAPSNPLYAMPELKFINDTLPDLMDNRAVELYNEAKRTNKKLAVMWSGGIDSTGVLSAFLKNIPTIDHEMIEVVLTTLSIFENKEYWLKYINGKLKQRLYTSIQLDTDFLDQYLLIHGDPGDCLFGPSMPMYKKMFVEGKHKQPHTTHRIDIKNRAVDGLEVDFNKWYYDKISNSIYELNQQDYISTVSDFWWWTYFNFKWEFSCQRPFFYMRLLKDNKGTPLFKKPISYEHQQQFARNTFFNTDKFQLWSYSNLKKLIPDTDERQHKIEMKKYTYDFDKNERYFYHKPKIGAKNPTQFVQAVSPVYYDKNWIGYLGMDDNYLVNKSVRFLMDKYKG